MPRRWTSVPEPTGSGWQASDVSSVLDLEVLHLQAFCFLEEADALPTRAFKEA